MNTKFKLMFLGVMALLSLPVFAGDSVGPITNPLVNEEGYFMFSAGTHNNKPACSIIGEAWVFDVTTPTG